MKTIPFARLIAGAVAGATGLILATRLYIYLYSVLFHTPSLPAAAYLQISIWSGALGALLGATSTAAYAQWCGGNLRQSSRLCLAGGFLFAALSFARTASHLLLMTRQAASGATIVVPGPDALPWQIRGVFLALSFNLPFLWSILLVFAGLHLRRRQKRQPR